MDDKEVRQRLALLESRMAVLEFAIDELMKDISACETKSAQEPKVALLYALLNRSKDLDREVEFLASHGRKHHGHEAKLRLQAVDRLRQDLSFDRELAHVTARKMDEILNVSNRHDTPPKKDS
ncbi:hypothetical protein [Thiobacter aerophilum]|uniref:Uncharacterized protein n=1 Tax=Thiobacter aerophilum TaxID=3121275 RepID=A0ABV0EE01_9BURK